ncbi:MAG: vitamin B12-dependent ribonucleotide reductase [Alphaproteobacteria bacterium]|nr:vitamin B12-dependent ribonucleotide reductase [Alphaproteobacteria bacterium]
METTPLTSTTLPTKAIRDVEPAPASLRFERVFTTEGVDPFDTVSWELRDATIGDASGALVFEQRNVEVPSSWSQTATNVVVSKYFRGHVGTPERERSIRQLLSRVCDTIAAWGLADGYFESKADAQVFREELVWLCLHQHVAFNSPVWFNVGVVEQPQCSACFINSVEDSMESILDLAKTEGMLFKWGSGTGTNLSPLRSSRELLRGGGTASGPVSFMRGFDAFAGVIKSGGKTRRAAKMVMLDVDHPDIVEFVDCKAEEEKKAWALIDAGYDGGFNVQGGAYDSVFFQNSNNSVRVSDDFMRAVMRDGDWRTRARTDGQVVEVLKARDVMSHIAEAAWLCGDPGMQYDTTVNAWHTCANTDRIHGSNPCSEYMFLDDSACNLASLNLMKFRGGAKSSGEMDLQRFMAAVRLTLTAQEILVDRAAYPTEAIGKNSHDFRPLGLGYANLGALLMSMGLPYDSEAGRAFAGAVTALMHGEAYRQSARLAGLRGPFAGFPLNRAPMLAVMRKHRDAARALPKNLPVALREQVLATWDACVEAGEAWGYRNAQVTVLAPTGTIGFMMDCDTTGIEPDIALIKYKKLVGGGMMKIVNQTVPMALERLGYDAATAKGILAWLDAHETIEGAPGLKAEHLPVFDCAFKPREGERSIAPMGHVRMMSAAQPFLSGAISKTVNVPNSATPADIADLYLEAWRLGLKAVAIYRDGCKRTQPLNTGKDEVKAEAVETRVEYRPVRRKLPSERQALTHKFSIAGHDGYITVGLYEDGTPGEIFLVMAKEGSVVSGLMDAFATSVSMALQYGVPLQVLCDKFSHTRYEPSGFTGNRDIPIAKSITDYIFRWLDLRFGEGAEQKAAAASAPVAAVELREPEVEAPSTEREVFTTQADAPPCHVCSSIMVRSGACYKCFNCGATSGCS